MTFPKPRNYPADHPSLVKLSKKKIFLTFAYLVNHFIMFRQPLYIISGGRRSDLLML